MYNENDSQQKVWNVIHQLKSIHTMMMNGNYQKAMYQVDHALGVKMRALLDCPEIGYIPEEIRLTEEMISECVSAIEAVIQMVFVMRGTLGGQFDGALLDCSSVRKLFPGVSNNG